MKHVWQTLGRWRWIGVGLTGIACVLFSLGGQPRSAHCQRAYKASTLVGAHRCRGCHQAAYKTWAQSAHAKAYAHLTAEDRKNPACLSCHTTGRAAHLQGVQCESCHGGGKYYVLPEVMVDPRLARAVGLKVVRGAKGCKTCHKPPSTKLRNFHYPTLWKKIAHGSK